MSLEVHLRNQYENVVRENKSLKTKLGQTERENHELKRSVMELSITIDHIKNQPLAFEIPDVTDVSDNTSTSNLSSSDSDVFQRQLEFKGHSGAIYTCKFSPCGRFIASGSFDQRIILWDATTQYSTKQRTCFTEHQQLVSDISWSSDSNTLLSASFDHTVRRWDIASNQCSEIHTLQGFVQTVAVSEDSNLYYAGTSKKLIYAIDARVNPTTTSIWQNEAMVNSIRIDGSYFVISGDSNGMIKTWDRRTGKCIESHLNDPNHHPISHVQGSTQGQFLAVNSYDNVLRLYDRDPKSSSTTKMDMVEYITGYKNKNWPIKSAFFCGEGNTYELNLPVPRYSRKSTDGDITIDESRNKVENEQAASMVLATGSADNSIYVYSVNSQQEDSAKLLQKIQGHTDRVYCVDFHPTEPILVSASADCTVKLWLPSITK